MGFRKIVFWIVGVIASIAMIIVMLLFTFGDFIGRRALARYDEEYSKKNAAWHVKHPKGCAEFASENNATNASGADVNHPDVYVLSEGHCILKGGNVVDARE